MTSATASAAAVGDSMAVGAWTGHHWRTMRKKLVATAIALAMIPVGILSARKVVSYLVEHFPGLVHNQPPALNKFPDTAEGLEE